MIYVKEESQTEKRGHKVSKVLIPNISQTIREMVWKLLGSNSYGLI